MGEDPKEFYEHLSLLIGSLAPRDAVEYEVATRLCGVFIKLDRLDRWSAATVNSATHQTAFDRELGAGSEMAARALAAVADRLSMYLNEVNEAEPSDWKLFALFVKNNAPGSKARLAGLWDDDHVPTTEKDWKKAFKSLKAHYWPEESEAIKWATMMSTKFSHRLEEVEGLEERLVADRILNGPFDRQIKYETRLFNNLKTIRKEYSELQRRQLGDVPEKTNPTDQEG